MQALAGSQLYSAFLGEGEAVLRNAFSRARAAAPSIIFLDELDALAGSRGSVGEASHGSGNIGAATRLLSALLTEMDGLELARGPILVVSIDVNTVVGRFQYDEQGVVCNGDIYAHVMHFGKNRPELLQLPSSLAWHLPF